MIEAIVRQELLLGARRTQLHVFRWVYAGWLIVQVVFLYFAFEQQEDRRQEAQRQANQNTGMPIVFTPASAPEVVGGWFCDLFLLQQSLLLLLAVPPLVAGAITEEKRRGTLTYLLTTDLDTRHIILGKLVGRSVQVLALLAAGLPLFALFAGFAGIPPLTLALTFLTLVPVLFALASASLLSSALCRQTRDAVLAVYLVGGIGLGLFAAMPVIGQWFDPRFALAPVWNGVSERSLALFAPRFLALLAGWSAIGLLSLGLAMLALRPVYRHDLEQSGPRRQAWYVGDRARLTDDPVAWRESEVEGLTPIASFRRMPIWLASVLISLATTVSSLGILAAAMPTGVTAGDFLRALVRIDLVRLGNLLPGADLGFLGQSLIVLLVATFLVGVRTSGCVTIEREKGTWDALMVSPLTDEQIVHGKLWGILLSSGWYLIAYAVPALVLSLLGGLLAFLWVLLWLGVTVLAMYFIGSTGLWASVRSKTSWGSLLVTLCYGYLGGVVIFLLTSPALFVLAGMLSAILVGMDRILQTQMAVGVTANVASFSKAYFIATCIGLAVAFFWAARLFQRNACYWITMRERAKHWEDDPEERLRHRRRRDPLDVRR